jgi:hypothetical protein
MIEWFDDLALGMRFKSGNVQITESDIKRFAAEYDPHRCIWTKPRPQKRPSKVSLLRGGIRLRSP